MDGAAGTSRNMASLDRKLESVLAAYRPVRIPGDAEARGPSNSGKASSLDDEGDSVAALANGRAPGSLHDISEADSLRESSQDVLPQGHSSGVSAITVDVGGESLQVSQQGTPDSRKEPGIRWHKGLKQAESASTAWTDDRHSSYLNSIEETFVRNMYDTDYCAGNAFGSRQRGEPSEQDCVESRAPDGFPELFELCQSGCWQTFYRPQALELPVPTPPSVLYSPWVQHFHRKASTSTSSGGGGTAAAHVDVAAAEELVEENILPDDVPETKQADQPDNGFQAWHSRLQQQISKKPSSPRGARGKRGIVEPEVVVRADHMRSKRQKCHQTLALIDLEMEENSSLGHLKADVGDHVAGCQGDNEQPAHDQPGATQVDEQPTLLVMPSQKVLKAINIAEPKEMLGSRSMQRVLLRHNVCIRGLPPLDVDQVVPLFGSSGAEDISERVVVPDICSQPKQVASDGMCDCKGCLDVSRKSSDHASIESNIGMSQMVRDNTIGAEAATTANDEKDMPSCNTVELEDDTPHRKRRSFKTWNWGLQGLRTPLLDKVGDSAE